MSESKLAVNTTQLIGKIDKIIELYRESQKKIHDLEEELESTRKDVQQLKKERQELQYSLNTSKFASALKGGSGDKEAIAKINRLVREIDNCIALLNK